jgi:hypothetical protein
MVGVSELGTGAGTCEELRADRTKLLEVVVDEVRSVTVFSDVDGLNPAESTEAVAVVVEVSSGSEGCDISIEVVEVVGARADESVAAASDRVLDLVFALVLNGEVALLAKLVDMLPLAGIVLFRRTFVHRLPRNVVIVDIWRASRRTWGGVLERRR